ncbi:MAG: hypothetical protein LBE76_07345 [Nitrososphaerota archaeon]|jgi:hypothetical protein|nr:hypothetical protein [Nitrososphaerota archaeon]
MKIEARKQLNLRLQNEASHHDWKHNAITVGVVAMGATAAHATAFVAEVLLHAGFLGSLPFALLAHGLFIPLELKFAKRENSHTKLNLRLASYVEEGGRNHLEKEIDTFLKKEYTYRNEDSFNRVFKMLDSLKGSVDENIAVIKREFGSKDKDEILGERVVVLKACVGGFGEQNVRRWAKFKVQLKKKIGISDNYHEDYEITYKGKNARQIVKDLDALGGVFERLLDLKPLVGARNKKEILELEKYADKKYALTKTKETLVDFERMLKSTTKRIEKLKEVMVGDDSEKICQWFLNKKVPVKEAADLTADGLREMAGAYLDTLQEGEKQFALGVEHLQKHVDAINNINRDVRDCQDSMHYHIMASGEAARIIQEGIRPIVGKLKQNKKEIINKHKLP